MRNLLLIRDTFNKNSTLGKLYLNGEFVGHTAELPFKDNQRSISCIPQGVYTCSIRQGEQSKSYNYEHLIVNKVPDREFILFHVGNNPQKDSKGCILLGNYRSDDEVQVFESRKCFNTFMELLKCYCKKNCNKTICISDIGKCCCSNKISLIIKNR